MTVTAYVCLALAATASQIQTTDDGGNGPPGNGGLTVEVGADPPGAVPLGTSVELDASVTGGVPPYSSRWWIRYGPPACGDDHRIASVPDETRLSYGVVKAGTHTVTHEATDAGTPPADGVRAVTLTGLPPDTLTPNAGVEDCFLDGGVDMFVEDIRIDVFAGQERMGPLYDDAAAYPQEQVEFASRNFDEMAGVAGLYLDTWSDFRAEPWGRDANGNLIWVPVRPGFLQFFWFVPGDGGGGGSYIHDGKGAGYTLARAQDLETRPAGFAFAAQRQRVRVQYTRDCGVEHATSDDVFYPTLVTTGVVNGGTPNPYYRYRDLGDWIINTADPR